HLHVRLEEKLGQQEGGDQEQAELQEDRPVEIDHRRVVRGGEREQTVHRAGLITSAPLRVKLPPDAAKARYFLGWTIGVSLAAAAGAGAGPVRRPSATPS